VSVLHTEVLLMTGYAVFLLAISLGLDLLARHSHNRSERYRTAGFTYHQRRDTWECPEGQHLLLSEVDYERRLLRYRGKAHICNNCKSKPDCTDSEEGREVVRALDPWPHSEAGRFHRGISLSMTLVATLILTAELVRNHALAEIIVLGTALAATARVAGHIHKAFRASPANFQVASIASPNPISEEALRKGYEKSKGTQH
jgi:hypothetical protein